MANELDKIRRELTDLTTMFDRMVSRMNEMDLDKLLRTETATGKLKEFQKAMEGVYGIESRVIEKIIEAIKHNERRKKQVEKEINLLQKKGVLTKDEQDNLQALQDLNLKYEQTQKNLEKQRNKEIATGEVAGKLKEKQALKTLALRKAADLLGVSMGQMNIIYQSLKIGAEAYMYVLSKLMDVHKQVFNWQNKLVQVLGRLAAQFGATTDVIVAMRQEGLNQLLNRGGLGDLGFGLEDIVAKLADFQQQMHFTNKVTQAQAASLIKMGMAAGMSAGQVGELTNSFVIMGMSAAEAREFMLDITTAARQSGVSAALMSRQFQGAGKSLLAFAGPAGRQQLLESAKALAQMGLELAKLKGFVDLTKSFDKTAESVAKLNTVFGTHINALELFAEQDPAKQIKMVTEELWAQGRSIDQLTYAEKAFLKQHMQWDDETMNAILRAAKGGKDIVEAMAEQTKVAEERAAAEEKYQESLQRSKVMLMAQQQLAARFNELATDAMEPLYRGFGYGGQLQKGMSIIDAYLSEWDIAIKAFKKNLDASGFAEAMFSVGESFGKIWKQTMALFKSPAMADFITGIMQAFSLVSRIIAAVWPVVTFVVRTIGQIVGVVGNVLAMIESVFGPIIDGIGRAADMIGNMLTAGLSVFKGGIDIILNSIKEFMKNLFFKPLNDFFARFGINNLFGNFDKQEAAMTTAAAGGQSSLAAPLGKGEQDGGMRGTEKKDTFGKIFGQMGQETGGSFMQVIDLSQLETRATGGRIDRDKMYLTSEKGQELFMSNVDGRMYSANETSSIIENATSNMTNNSGLNEVKFNVQVFLDSELIQDRMYKQNLRSVS